MNLSSLPPVGLTFPSVFCTGAGSRQNSYSSSSHDLHSHWPDPTWLYTPMMSHFHEECSQLTQVDLLQCLLVNWIAAFTSSHPNAYTFDFCTLIVVLTSCTPCLWYMSQVTYDFPCHRVIPPLPFHLLFQHVVLCFFTDDNRLVPRHAVPVFHLHCAFHTAWSGSLLSYSFSFPL